MREYKYELHCHTSDVSLCASSGAADAVKFYKERGFDGIVITDHYSPQTFLLHRALMPQKYINHYMKGYRRALEAAGDDFTVLLGCEVRFLFTIDDFLIYGVDEEFLKGAGNMLLMYLRRLYKLCDSRGLILLEAHPFRKMRFRHNPRYLHGCEIFNGKDYGTEANVKAKRWADECNFRIRTSGGDFHNRNNTVPGGIITTEPIKTNEDLLRILRSGNYKIIGE